MADGSESKYVSDSFGVSRAVLLSYSNLNGKEETSKSYYVLAKYSSESFEESITNDKNNYLRFDFSSREGFVSQSDCVSRFECSPRSLCINDSVRRECIDKNPECRSNPPIVSRRCLLESSSKETLFDINLELLSDDVESGESLSLKVFLLNIGVPGEVDANVYYEVYDEIGDIVYSESEIVKVQTQTEFIKSVDLSNFPDGRYTITAELSYEGQVEPASTEAKFNVGDVEDLSLVFYSVVFFFIVVLLLILYFFLIRSSK